MEFFCTLLRNPPFRLSGNRPPFTAHPEPVFVGGVLGWFFRRDDTKKAGETGSARSAGPTAGCCRGGHTNSGTIDWSSRILRGRKPRGNYPTRVTNAAPEALPFAVTPTHPTQAPYCASPTLCLRHYFPANLVVQLELLCLFPTTKNWPDRNVSI